MRAWATAVLASTLVLAGCATQLGPPSPSADNLLKARAAKLAPLQLGSFRLAEGRPQAMDQRVTVRTTLVASPVADSMAAYLRATLEAELQAAGLLAPDAATVLSGELTDSDANAATGTASARLAARFVLTRDSRVAYSRELAVQHRWASAFVGIEAIPAAINEYTLLYRKLVGQLLDDPAFREAMARR